MYKQVLQTIKELGDAGEEYLHRTNKLDAVKEKYPTNIVHIILGVGFARLFGEESAEMKENLKEKYSDEYLQDIIQGAIKNAS